MRPEPASRPPRLPEALQVCLVALFGGVCVLLIWFLDAPGLSKLELFALATSGAALLTSLVWFFALAVRQRSPWAFVLAVPYLNLIAASWYAQLHWRDGARGPAMLALVSLLLQLAASLGALFTEPGGLV
jgi:hypothetical protein